MLHGSTGRGYVTHAMRKAQCTAATHRLPSFTSVNHTCRIGWSMPNTRSSSHRRPHSDRCALSSFSVCGTSVSLHNGTCWLQGRLATEGATRNVRGTCVEKMSYDTAATRAHHRLALIPNLGPMSASEMPEAWRSQKISGYRCCWPPAAALCAAFHSSTSFGVNALAFSYSIVGYHFGRMSVSIWMHCQSIDEV